MSDHIRFTISKNSDGSVSAFSRRTGKQFDGDNIGDLWTTIKHKLGADRHWVRKSQWVVRCGGSVVKTVDVSE
jgi:hypothetical protein